MSGSRPIAPVLVFTAGLLAGAALQHLAPAARADAVDWQQISQQPEFRAAVIEVINSCIVDNGIIFCN